MSERRYDDFDSYDLNYDKILQHREFSSVVKQLVLELNINPYKTLGQFLQQLSTDDLRMLLNKVEKGDLEEVLLLSEMLSRAEGIMSENVDVVARNVNQLSMFIAAESLVRKGLVKAFYENMSFGEDSDKKVVFKRVDL
jgi:hypothetical protein